MSSGHIDDQTLLRWIKFDLAVPALEEVDGHLLACQTCGQRLEAQLESNPFPIAASFQNSLLETIAGAAMETVGDPAGTNEFGIVEFDLHGTVAKLHLHGAGGIGRVWLARDLVLDREIALKEVRPEARGSATAQRRFIREATITGQLEHPGIVPVHQLVNDNGRLFYTMRFLEGQPFSQVIRAYHEMADEAEKHAEFLKLLGYLVDVCNAVAYAHSNSVIHRDLKSDNVVIGEFGEVIVVDWGLAKRLSDPAEKSDDEEPLSRFESSLKTMHGQRLGTPAFMAPEQAAGDTQNVGPPADVYGLSTMLYEILTGRVPFQAATIEETLERVIQSRPDPPHAINPDVSAELESICMAGLAKNQDARPASAKDLGAMIRQWIARQSERKRSEIERQRFFNLSIDMMAILDAEGRICEANDAWEKTLGWSHEELLGKTHLDLMHPQHRKEVTRAVQSTKKGIAKSDVEVLFRTKDGGYRWTLWNATPIEADHQTYVIGRDITERKELEIRFARLFDSAPDAMIVVTDQAKIQMVNSQAEQMFGYDRHELIGEPLEVLLPERFRAGHHLHFQQYLDARTLRPMDSGLQLFGVTKSGFEFEVEISLSPVESEAELLIACAIRNCVGERPTKVY